MARHRHAAASEAPIDLFASRRQQARDGLAKLLGPDRPARKYRAPMVGPKERGRYRAQAEEMKRSGDWAEAKGGHLVGLYESCHELVYGVAPSELGDSRTYAMATRQASQLLEQLGVVEAVLFLRWVWEREEEREQWRKRNGRDGSRIGWRFQFAAGALLTDYRLHQHRTGSRAATR